ncbi:hypothetical protein KXW98_001032 [Aspergillus fumigatus]|uniref:Uncharacterized protein n=1 Tax=Aspergillus fumigatus TaxID=746128 RepID=A0A229Y4T4_ASPFM|nr:hypothetical protein CNMCM8714_000787 [Aspergillus fumigatus]KMK58842.1 CRAL/TRIO domain-containing protein [Aspergillus fumigatus Z5]KAF4274022.1 hypothetical protein CNMCM8812_006426 [Aspergillus fumigatus]KAF4276593.1 hypothetical protein CNMCM8057_004207 [Aspergillus fumigatus]KAF4286764.1 hypothetical protein CNMCM8689_001893 [Aspergillus fumigatus]
MAAHETAILAQFSRLCLDKGLLQVCDDVKDGDRADGIADETTLRRFLQARRMDLPSALGQFEEAIQFRREKDALRVYDRISVDDFEHTRKLYPHWTGRRDKQGSPIVMLETVHLDQKAITHWHQTRQLSGQSSSPDMEQRALAYFDYLTRFVFPLCSALQDRPLPSEPVTKAIYLIDGSSICLRQAWNLRDFSQDVSWILATCYPETIDRIFLCNPPSYFPKMWSMLKKFIDPVTAEKIVMLDPADVYGTLNKYIHHDNIPVQFGGAFEFTHGMLPDLCPVTRQTLRWSPPFNGTFPPGPIKWTEHARGQIKAVAIGTVDGVERGFDVATLDIEEEK